MNKKIYIAFVLVSFLLIEGFLLFAKRSEASELERRKLNTFPELTAEAYWTGTYTEGISNWFSDTVPMRDALMERAMRLMDAKGVGSDENGDAIPVMEQDLKAYGEITMPELGPNLHVDVDKHGQGDYTFYTDASYSACGTDINKNFNGAVSRSICTVYDPKVIADFAVFSPEIWQAGTPVGSMKDGATYFAYALLKDPMSYDEFFGDYGQNDEYGTNASWLWAATSVSEDDTEGAHKSLGFFADTGATEGEAMVFDTEKAARDHFRGLLSYIAESGKFAELRGSIWVEGEPYAEYAKFVRDEGLSVYGFVYVSDKEHIEKLVESEDIAKVSVREV